MVCTSCNKESNNRRVCPYCFTPYPAEGPQSRGSTSLGRVSGTGGKPPYATGFDLGPFEPVRAWFLSQTKVVRFSAIGIIVVGGLWMVTKGEALPTAATPTVVSAGVVAMPMTREEAVALLRHTRETALVDEQSDEVAVSYPAATFPVQPEGQVMLAMRFVRADELVIGRKRRIFFHAPSGRMFAQSDAVTGLTVVK